MMDSGTETITTIHLALIVVFAVLVVIGIMFGMRLKRRRVAGEKAVEARADAAGVEDAPTPVTAAPVPVAPPPPPLAAPTPADLVPAPEPLADEPVAAAAPLDASPATVAVAPATSSASPADSPVTQLKGLGPKVAARLGELGITDVGQIAALTEDRAAALDAELGPFSGRMARDRWIEQARFLAAGDKAGFEAVFGKL